MARRLSYTDWIKKANAIWQNEYDYSNSKLIVSPSIHQEQVRLGVRMLPSPKVGHRTRPQNGHDLSRTACCPSGQTHHGKPA